jgi:adenylosuccinate synthase
MAIDINGVNQLVLNKVDVLDKVKRWCVYSGFNAFEFDKADDMKLWITDELKTRVTNVTFSGDKHAI